MTATQLVYESDLWRFCLILPGVPQPCHLLITPMSGISGYNPVMLHCSV